MNLIYYFMKVIWLIEKFKQLTIYLLNVIYKVFVRKFPLIVCLSHCRSTKSNMESLPTNYYCLATECARGNCIFPAVVMSSILSFVWFRYQKKICISGIYIGSRIICFWNFVCRNTYVSDPYYDSHVLAKRLLFIRIIKHRLVYIYVFLASRFTCQTWQVRQRELQES